MASGEPGESFQTNLSRAGELFIYSLWIQGQMADLLIFRERPDLIPEFLRTPEVMPSAFVELRTEAWQSDFSPTKTNFVSAFRDHLDEQDLADLDFLNALRNAIAHSHVSVGRDYFLYRPRSRNEAQVVGALGLQPREGAPEPPLVKLAFFDDAYYLSCFARVKRLDESCLAKVASALGVTHSRIR